MNGAIPPQQRRHFHVAAREMLLEVPQRCPFLPTLTMDGLAVTSQGDHHLIMTLAGTDRLYLGPDTATVERRARILAVALHHGAAALGLDHAGRVGDWVVLAWEAALDEIVDAICRPAQAQL